MRTILTLWHRYVGLALVPFLTLAAITGVLLVWNQSLERFFAPALFVLPASARHSGYFLDPFTLRDKAAAAFPQASIDGVDLTREVDQPIRFYLAGKRGFAPLPFDEIALNPRTGALLGARRNGDITQGWINFMPFVYRMHDSLAMGGVGATLLGIAATVWWIDCFIGAILTFPVRAAMPRTPRSWLMKWRDAWSIWRSASARKLAFTVHRAAGLWPWVMLLILATSSIAFNLPAVYRPILKATLGTDDTVDSISLAQLPERPPALDLHNGYRAARVAMAAAALREGFIVQSERLIYYDRSRHAYAYRVKSDRDPGRRGNTQIYVDADSGATLALDVPIGQSAGATFTHWISILHTAAVFGRPMQFAVCLTGLLVLVLNITGVTIFLRKRRVRAALARSQAATA